MPEFAVILPAAGNSTRFGSSRNKLTESLDGVAVLARSLRAFLIRSDVSQIIVATQDVPQSLQNEFQDKRVVVCKGGSCRAESVKAAASVISKQLKWVAVHDAARPLVSQELIDRTLSAAVEHGAAGPVL